MLEKSSAGSIVAQLSLQAMTKLKTLRRNDDKLLLLTSSVLLSRALSDNGYNGYKLCDLQYSETGRPFFVDSPFDFNISHTDNCAIVAFLENGRVGIDIETIKDVDFRDFEYIFTQKVWDQINASNNKNEMFYYYWTLLESALKADGRGLPLISSNKIEIENDQVIIDEKRWFSNHPHFDPTISCCVTSDIENEATQLVEIKSI